jgi:2-C-methyl-D-erythritol 2,4-cyclodiphosphate synthase
MINEMHRLRIGQGYDVHRLVMGRPLILGGVTIPFELGLDGHSDADVLLHAMTDALLGAANLGDIGQHFSDLDPTFKNADSTILLQQAYQKVRLAGFEIINMDASVIAQQPKLMNYLPSMVAHIANALNISPSRINLKAKTNERLGYLGRVEAIEAQVVALLMTST